MRGIIEPVLKLIQVVLFPMFVFLGTWGIYKALKENGKI